MKIGDVVLVEWQDHYSNNSGWASLNLGKETTIKEMFCSSVGLVIGDDKKQIVLAQSWHPDEDRSDHRVADFMVIIKRCIKKVTVLKAKVAK